MYLPHSVSGECAWRMKFDRWLYGSPGAGRGWYETISKKLDDMDFETCTSENCLRVKRQNNEWIVLLLYVDDILACTNSPKLMIETQNILMQDFNVTFKAAKEGCRMIGHEIKITPSQIQVSQRCSS